MCSNTPVIVWFRQDLRRTDNPALAAAADSGHPVLPVYILDDVNTGGWQMGAASRWWLHQSLTSLNTSLRGHLRYFRGDAAQILMALTQDVNVAGVSWNRCYEPWRIDRDRRIKAELKKSGCSVESFNGSLLFEPQLVAKADGSPYKAFTPFFRKGCLRNGPPPRLSIEAPEFLSFDDSPLGHELDELELMPSTRWYDSIACAWTPGETGALERLERFLDDGIRNYREGRNRPDLENVSRLSPHLHFGEISPHQIWHGANALKAIGGPEKDIDDFQSELGWREFSNYLLYHWPALPHDNLQEKFDRFPWRDDPESLRRWQRGQTGYPIVDAGMRELWQTGYMHNRARMIVGSFLVKNLLLHWRHGEAWFWDTLVDADLANNSASWQWIAGCGADAAPYFRIFNPVTQGHKFDPKGDYARRFVPEVAGLPDRFLHSPWEAPPRVLAAAGIELGSDYPHPMVDLRASRERALDVFRSIGKPAVAS